MCKTDKIRSNFCLAFTFSRLHKNIWRGIKKEEENLLSSYSLSFFPDLYFGRSQHDRNGPHMERSPELLRHIVITQSILNGDGKLVLGDKSEEILMKHVFQRITQAVN